MDEAVVKQGGMFLQLQQTFGKKWKKFWAVLYRESSCSTARLELLEGPERPRKAEGSRRLVRLSDCVHVAEVGGDATCPKDTVPFLLETTERRFLLAADGAEAAEWIQRLCELAFPRSREEPGVAKEGTEGEFSMEENSLYSSRGKAGLEQAFEVTVRVTPSSQRCRLRGRGILRAGEEALELWHPQSQELLASWPYRFLRRFGRDKVTFSFEAGRRCASGEGNFEFDTRQGNEIFQAIEAAIEVQRGRGAEEPRRGGPVDETPRPLEHARTPGRAQGHEEGKGVKGRPVMPPGAGEASGPFQLARGADCPYAEPHDALRRGNAAAPPDTGRRPDGARVESEYAVPFDTIAKSLLARQFGGLGCPQEGLPEPPSVPRDAGGAQQPPGRPTAPKPEHIYDEPEGLSGLSLYDEPQEVKGEAWRLQAAPEEPPGLGTPYNAQRDDYAVPKRPFLLQGNEWLGDCDYDNVALRVAKKRNLQ
ncbi:docking protein 2 isoform X1 [Passer montanus]|uniref:docking protein 2 isoform X1 n=2 Tax=Passer montanus TaxID=9160 RepID=UPI001961402A|nr:docking protein 2 isoform X1 [Passer montanus]